MAACCCANHTLGALGFILFWPVEEAVAAPSSPLVNQFLY